MAHSRVCVLVHLVFATAERRPRIREDILGPIHQYLGGIARQNGMIAMAIGGTEDHVHLLLSLPRTFSIAKAVQLLTGGSSKWIHDTYPGSRSFAWQDGYGAFSIGVSQIQTTVRYIDGQAEHHKKFSFAAEMKKFMEAHVVEAQWNRTPLERGEGAQD